MPDMSTRTNKKKNKVKSFFSKLLHGSSKKTQDSRGDQQINQGHEEEPALVHEDNHKQPSSSHNQPQQLNQDAIHVIESPRQVIMMNPGIPSMARLEEYRKNDKLEQEQQKQRFSKMSKISEEDTENTSTKAVYTKEGVHHFQHDISSDEDDLGDAFYHQNKRNGFYHDRHRDDADNGHIE